MFTEPRIIDLRLLHENKGESMRSVKILFLLVCLLGIPAIARAQASITGVVKDTSGAVLPGVTVEAASAVLIEKVRVAPSPTAPASTGSSICGPAPTP